MESIGGWVKNVQLIAIHPFFTMKKIIMKRAIPFNAGGKTDGTKYEFLENKSGF